MLKVKYISYVIILLLNYNLILSQQENGVREFNKPSLQQARMWYDSSTANYQTQYPIIRNLPPLNTGMQFDILLSYVFLDSLLRNKYNIEIKNKINTWNTNNDTISNAIKYLYSLVDYNPVIFKQYEFATLDYYKIHNNLVNFGSKMIDTLNPSLPNSIDSVTTSGKYTASLDDVCTQVRNKFNDFVGNEINAVNSMLRPDYILRIKVNSIDSTINSNNYGNEYIYQVNAEVLDTIKGHYFNNECITDQMLLENKNNEVSSINNVCIKFMYRNLIYNEDRNPLQLKLEPSFKYNGDYFRMLPNQEAIVFLKFNRRYVDYSFDYFELYLDVTSSFSALAIIDGKVSDLNHFWSNQDLIDYSLWKARYDEIKNKILNNGY